MENAFNLCVLCAFRLALFAVKNATNLLKIKILIKSGNFLVTLIKEKQ
jgi:hypothetical protein